MSQAYMTGDLERIFRYSELWVSIYETHCGHLALSLDRHFVPDHLSIINAFVRLGEDSGHLFDDMHNQTRRFTGLVRLFIHDCVVMLRDEKRQRKNPTPRIVSIDPRFSPDL